MDNFLLFQGFELSMSYPKKIVRSSISTEHLSQRQNFRYKKLIVLMGANATGKTALGKVLMGIFNFINKKNSDHITKLINNPNKEASFIIDFAYSNNRLVRVETIINSKKDITKEYSINDIKVVVKEEQILQHDNYEKCISRLINNKALQADSYIEALEKVPPLSWKFEYPFASSGRQQAIRTLNTELFGQVLEKTLKALDPRIQKVTSLPNIDNAFGIFRDNDVILIEDGKVINPEKLSSGTVEGIGIADIVSAMILRAHDFYYCDEKFSHIHSDPEKAFLSLFIELLGPDEQMIFTSHNSDVLEMDLPKHSFAFMRRDPVDNTVSCVYASDYLKKNTISLKNAVENDLFGSSPDLSKIYEIEESRVEQ